MGTPGLAGPAFLPSAVNQSRAGDRAKRSIMARFTGRVRVPVGIMALIWTGMSAATLGGAFGDPGAWSSGRAIFWTASICVAALVIVAVALMLTASFVQQMARETSDLAIAAHRIADVRLPAELEVLRAGGSPGEREPVPVSVSAVTGSSSAEISEVSAAIADLHRAALSAASAEAGLRSGLRQVLVSLGRRNQSLIHRQLRIIDKLEKQASGSAELGDLFSLDHLTTRMRRHAESLTVLAGEAPGRSWSMPVPVVDVMRAAAAEVEDYKRVVVRSDAGQAIAAPAVTDMIHLLAELIENATLFSPSTTKVEVRAESVANGFVIEIEDRGLGIPADQLREINARLADAPDEDLADADRLGLFVAARLAARHGVQVSLNPSAYRGTKAVVVLPTHVVVAAPSDTVRLTGEQEAVGSGRLNLQAPGVLALAGSDLARRSDPVTAGPSVFTPSLESLSAREPLSHRGSLASRDDRQSSSEALPARAPFPGERSAAERGLGETGHGETGHGESRPGNDALPGRRALPRRERATRSEAVRPTRSEAVPRPRQDSPPGWDTLPGGDAAESGQAPGRLPPVNGHIADGMPDASGPATGVYPVPGRYDASASPATSGHDTSTLAETSSEGSQRRRAPSGLGVSGMSTANGLNLGRGMSSASGLHSDPSSSANNPASGRHSERSGPVNGPVSSPVNGPASSPVNGPASGPASSPPNVPGGRDWFTARTSSPESAGFTPGAGSWSGAGSPADTGSPIGTGSPAGPGLPRRTGLPANDAAEEDPTRSGPARPGLPRRVRAERSRPMTRQAPPDSPVPDQARSLASSLQTSWRRSQQNNDVPGPAPGSAGEEES